MIRSHCHQRMIACMVAVIFLYLSVVVAPVKAALIGTSDILNSRETENARQKVMLFLERQEVVTQLNGLGIDRQEAINRVAAMTEEEIHLVAERIDQMPAGGNILGFLVGVAFVAFVTLIITDIIGITDIFTFIKKR